MASGIWWEAAREQGKRHLSHLVTETLGGHPRIDPTPRSSAHLWSGDKLQLKNKFILCIYMYVLPIYLTPHGCSQTRD